MGGALTHFEQPPFATHQPHYRTLDDMTQAERDALCAQYNTTISSKREPYEDAPWKIGDNCEGLRQAVEEVLTSPRASSYVRKACAKLKHGLEYRGYLSQHQKAQLRRWHKQVQKGEPARVQSEAKRGAPVAGSPRALGTPARKKPSKRRAAAKAKPKSRSKR